MKRLIAVALLLPLAGCLTVGGGSSGPKCPQTYKWSKPFQSSLASEVEKMPGDSAAKEAVAELVELREWVHANCN